MVDFYLQSLASAVQGKKDFDNIKKYPYYLIFIKLRTGLINKFLILS